MTTLSTQESQARRIAAEVMAAALSAVDPAQAIYRHVHREGDILQVDGRAYDLARHGRIYVVGAGKAGAPMAAALAGLLGDRLAAGIVNVKKGHTATERVWQVGFGGGSEGESGRGSHPDPPPLRRGGSGRSSTLSPEGRGRGSPADVYHPRRRGLAVRDEGRVPITLIEAGHPVPDEAGRAGAERIKTLLTGLRPDDLVFCLLSGGGSALLPLPAGGITLADKQALTGALLRSGATINEINTVRKHCSQVKGGQLARWVQPASLVCLILSDVVGNPLDVIASGPTVPDTSTFADAWAVLKRYGLEESAPSAIIAHLRRWLAGDIPETPKSGDPAFTRTQNVLIGDNGQAAAAGVARARELGLRAEMMTTWLEGEAREVGRVAAALAKGLLRNEAPLARPACWVLGGETTVTVRGQGRGGRNQELALAAALALDGWEGALVAALATDGNDGPTDAAGAIATGSTIARGRAAGLDALASLAANDSYRYFSALGDLIITGPTNTNVNDLLFVFAF
ncbi:MAG: glycerate kinase [Anaerolineae bacterium]|nr:glycerate kinase [Anaerolineae bacterium]